MHRIDPMRETCLRSPVSVSTSTSSMGKNLKACCRGEVLRIEHSDVAVARFSNRAFENIQQIDEADSNERVFLQPVLMPDFHLEPMRMIGQLQLPDIENLAELLFS
jgi:hypothetical protein